MEKAARQECFDGSLVPPDHLLTPICLAILCQQYEL